MTDRKDTLRRLLAGETVTLGPIAPEHAEHFRRAMDALAERSEREWREARPDTAASTVAIHHVRAADIAAARDHLANSDGDDPVPSAGSRPRPRCAPPRSRATLRTRGATS